MTDKIKILIVDDNALLRATLTSELSANGYDVREASAGDTAIPMIYGTEFKFILLDLKMPYIDGFEVLKFIKGTFPKTIVIVLTAYADLANHQKCKNLGADEVVNKPYNISFLLSVIQRVTKN
jgi:CheY-like chemotaxis protein